MALTDRGMDVIALGLNDQQHGGDAKLSSADPHMLAAYCFDLTRKLHYMYMALRLESGVGRVFDSGYGVRDLQTLAGKIHEETQAVETAAQEARDACGEFWTRECDWGVRSHALEGIIRDQYRAIQEDYTELYGALLKRPPPTHTPPPESRQSR
jgi:hypothetical protein